MALAPLLLAVSRSASLRRAFLVGATTGIVYFAGTLYWITRVMAVYGGLALPVAVLVNATLVVYLAGFPAIFAMVMARLWRTLGPRALAAAPFVWVATELGRTYFPFSGFPWVLLGYSQVTVLPVAQLASLFGVYGVSALVASVSAAFASTALARRRAAGANRYSPYAPLAGTIVLVLAVAAWGSLRVAGATLTHTGVPVRVGLVQGNVDQAIKYDASHVLSIFGDYLRMTREAIGQGAELIIWPESSTPFYFEEERNASDQLRALARQSRVSILVGSDQIAPPTSPGQGPAKYYNSAFLVAPDGTTAGVYRKIHLVPFGEYVPYRRVLFFAAPLVEAVSDFSPGDRAVLLPIGSHPISTAICYEIVYPELVRRFVADGSELLTTITNDAWFGETSAPYQHFQQAAMRAIENGRYLVRSANTGVSGIVDPYGRFTAESAIFQPAVLVGDVRFLRAETIYTRTGDVFAYASALAAAAVVVAAYRTDRRRRRIK